MENKKLSYEEFQDLAMKNYNKGGDCVVECWDEKAFNEHCRLFGYMSYSGAMKIINDYYEEQKEEEEYRRWVSGLDEAEMMCDLMCGSVEEEFEPDEFEEDYDDRDFYSPSCPWNAPGMSVSDFI